MMTTTEHKADMFGEKMPSALDNTVIAAFGEQIPVVQLPGDMYASKQQLYDEVKKDAEHHYPGVTMPQYPAYCKMLNKDLPQLKIRKCGKFANCTYCNFVKTMLRYCGHNSDAKQYWELARAKHKGTTVKHMRNC